MEQTVAKFNSMYLGGTAHELGHGLGLPHDAGTPAERNFGTSLMGSGNLTYRRELWGGGSPVILARASALQLASHPLITGSNRGRWEAIGEGLDDLTFASANGELGVSGHAGGKVPPYGVIAYVWPECLNTDHRALTFPTVLDSSGKFTLTLGGLHPEKYRMKLATLHVNGSTSAREFRFGYTPEGQPDVAGLRDAWQLSRAETAVVKRDAAAFSKFTKDEASSEDAQRKMRILKAVLQRVPEIDLEKTDEPKVYLSDARWSDASVGWGKVARNYNWFDDSIQNGAFLTLQGEVFEKGLYAHSPSRFVFPTAGRWKTFTATIGIRDGAQTQGSAVFTIKGDGKELYRSPILRVGSREAVKVDVSGVASLELLANGGEGHSHNSWAIWVSPMVER